MINIETKFTCSHTMRLLATHRWMSSIEGARSERVNYSRKHKIIINIIFVWMQKLSLKNINCLQRYRWKASLIRWFRRKISSVRLVRMCVLVLISVYESFLESEVDSRYHKSLFAIMQSRFYRWFVWFMCVLIC